MRKKAVLFDFDGTICNTVPLMLRTLNKMAFGMGRERITREDFESLRAYSIKELMSLFKVPFFKIPFLIVKARSEFTKHIDDLRLYEGLDSMLAQLEAEGYRLGILSSSPKNNIEYLLGKYGIRSFEFVESELNIFGKGKAILGVCRTYGIPKDELVYVGDEIRDIEACRDSGVDIISVTWGLNNEEGLARNGALKIARRPADVPKLIGSFA
jgi:phosphoglycolate phosphatase